MGLDGGFVQSEVVVMGEELVVSSGTVVYQEDVPGVITYNGNVLMSEETPGISVTQSTDIDHSIKFGTASVTDVKQDIISSEKINHSEVITTSDNVNKKIKSPVKVVDGMSLEELGCHDNNTIVEEEVTCQESECDELCNKIESQGRDTDPLQSTLSKSYALTPDPGTATRRGGPGPTKRQSQRYRKAWEQFPELKDWLSSHHNVYRAVCRICNKVLLADFTVIKAHATSRKHMYLADKFLKTKQRISSSLKFQVDSYLEEVTDGLPIAAESGAVGGGAGPEGSYKEDYERKFSDPSKGSSGAGGGGSSGTQSLDNSEGNYPTGIYIPQQRNVGPPMQMVSKAVVMSPAPNWKATAIVNGHVTRLDLSDYVGRYLILVFYPQDFSKICASEINALSDRAFEFRAIQTEIVACSVDSHLAHLTWSKLSRADGGVSLPKIPLLADPTHAIARAYGVLLPDKGHTLRAHFIIDKRGILRHMSVTDTLVGRGTDELFRLVKALQYVDEVEEPVPADWTQPTE